MTDTERNHRKVIDMKIYRDIGRRETTVPVDGIKIADLKRLRDVYRDMRLPALLEHVEAVLAERAESGA